MKKGISLIVLVITIIVMIIIAGAIILALNSSSVTGKATWAQISSDRANLQSEFATILAQVIADENVTDNFDGVTVTDLQGITGTGETKVDKDTDYDAWKTKVTSHKSNILSVAGDDAANNANPAGIKVIATMTAEQADAFGIAYTTTTAESGEKTYTATGYDWVVIN